MLKFSCVVLATASVLLASPSWYATEGPKVEAELVSRCGKEQAAQIHRGLEQTAALWRDSDGGAEAFHAFVTANYAGDAKTRDALFERFQRRLEILDGHMVEIGYEFRLHTDLDRGEVLPVDELFAAYSPSAHTTDDFFENKIAFVALLNFPLTTLEQRLGEGAGWSRRHWAEVRLASRFEQRIPADVLQGINQAQSDADLYINQYNIWPHHLVDASGARVFGKGLKLVTHWNLRDEIKARYADTKDGLVAQRAIARVMARIVDQTIPQVAINNPAVDWNPFSNEVTATTSPDSAEVKPATAPIDGHAEPDTRYVKLLALFKANQAADVYSPGEPTLLARRFDVDRQMSEKRVVAMLESVLSAPEFRLVAERVKTKLGRPLEPFDIWYNGFRTRGKYTPTELDALTRKKYPTAEAYRKDIPAILQTLGFRKEKADWLQTMIDVEPARGPGHALGGGMRGQKARLRTRVEADGMNYKGFNIAVHEMGHNVEQSFSLNAVDYTLLSGVPNTAFTEALAMLLQSHDLEVLGLQPPDARERASAALDLYWQTAEISGVALVDIGVWHWLYEHPTATPAELKQAVLEISKGVWNRFFAPAFGEKDVTLLAIYSHMIFDPIYLPDYPVGHLIQCQVEAHMRKVGNLGDEYERITTFGNLPPDLWMQNATGKPVGAEALLEETREALALLKP